MKLKVILLAFILFLSFLSEAQKADSSKWDFGVGATYWMPYSNHLNAKASSIFCPESNGYGKSTLEPIISVKYFFKNGLGLSSGFYPISLRSPSLNPSLDNNTANFSIIFFGFNFRKPYKYFTFFMESGLVAVSKYKFTYWIINNYQPIDITAKGNSKGGYFKIGTSIKIYKSFWFSLSANYSFIPVRLSYSDPDDYYIREVKTNLGGIGISAGIRFRI